MKLSELKNGDKGILTKIRGRGAFRKRILEMGFTKGREITVIKNAPLKDPIEYKLIDYNVSLRRSEAELIDVLTPDEIIFNHHQKKKRRGSHNKFHDKDHNFKKLHHKFPSDRRLRTKATEKGKIINVALVGNPNSGKTTLFNHASGSREHVGNYGGVTVDAKTAKFKLDGYSFNITDLPGTYSITAYTPEELFVRNFIFENTPDVIINIIDSSNLERNLYLTTQLIDMDIKVVGALNIYDELTKKNDDLDYELLGKMIGIPLVPTVSSKGKGIKDLFRKVIDVFEDKDDTVRHIHINYGNDLENSIHTIQDKIKGNYSLTDKISSRYLAIKLIEGDRAADEKIFQNTENQLEIFEKVRVAKKSLKEDFKEDTETLITDARYGFIAGALKETFKKSRREDKTYSDKIDNILTHRYIGFPIFIFFLWFMFEITFTLGSYPMNWIDSGIGILSDSISGAMSDGMLKNLLVNGIIAGVGGVIIFLPNILLLFFMISIMEDTGYMSRASFIMDKLMHKLGLHGKSFIPLIMGFGCNVPAIMATRTLESRNDRILTMLILPFMSCSARLPVYVLFISAFFPAHPGSMLFLIYMIGIMIAIISAIFLKKTFFRKNEIPFVMELPPYRIPRMYNTAKHMWEKGSEYLKKIAGVVLVASILIWALGAFPKNIEFSKNYDNQINEIKADYNQSIQLLDKSDTTSLKTIKQTRDNAINEIKIAKHGEKLEKSYIGQIGHFIEPVMQPLGFDWKMGVSIVTGLAAKEIVVSTMGVLYHTENGSEESSKKLINQFKNEKYTSGEKKGEKIFSPLIAFAFMIFILTYFPCVAVIAAIKKETDSWKWALFAALYTTSMAWVISFLIYQVGRRLI